MKCRSKILLIVLLISHLASEESLLLFGTIKGKKVFYFILVKRMSTFCR